MLQTFKAKKKRMASRSAVRPASRKGSSRLGRSALKYVTPLYQPLERSPLGQSVKCTHRYVDNSGTLTGALGIFTYVWSLNSLFDPNVTGVGHQVLGFDQMKLMYAHYTVTRARATVTYQNLISAGQVATVCHPHLQASSGGTVNYVTSIENGNAAYKLTLPYTSNGCPSVQSFSFDVEMDKFFGKKIIDEDDYRGTPSAGPSEQCYLSCDGQNIIQATADNHTHCIMIVIEYDTIWSEPLELA